MPLFKWVLPVIIVMLSGCAGPVISPGENRPSATDSTDALGTFLDYARTAQAQGDYYAADGWLLRALRISPGAPAVYYQMAVLRQAQGQTEQARQLAARALSLDPDRAMTLALNRLLRQL